MKNNSSFYSAIDVYAAPTSFSAAGNYDIGNVKLLYEINSSVQSLTPTIGVTYDGTRAAAGDRIDLYEGAQLLGSSILTSANTGSSSMTLNVEMVTSLGSGTHNIQAKYVDTGGTTVTSSDVVINIPTGVVSPTFSGLKVNGLNINDSTTAYAMVSSLGTSDGTALTFTGTLTQKSLVSISLGGQTIAFGDFAAGNFSLSAAMNVVAPGYYSDLKITVVDTSTGASAGQVSVLQNQKLGWYWLGQAQGNTNGGNGNDTILLGSMASSTGATTIQTGLGNDTVSVGIGSFSGTTNLTATVSDFTLGQDKLAVRGQTITAANLSNYLTSATGATAGGGTKLVIDLDGAGSGTTNYTLFLSGVAYDAANMNRVFGV